jgi:hypothetical protein
MLAPATLPALVVERCGTPQTEARDHSQRN